MLERLKQQVSPFVTARRWFVAYSGGLDSHVLLHALAQLKQQDPSLPEIIALHINHQLQQVSDEWQQHCQNTADSLAINFISETVDISAQANIEAAAREARYQVFEQQLQADDVLMVAHHLNDQVETFFYRLFRGAGVKGLAAMPAQRPLGQGLLCRPLLESTRKELELYANQQQLQWIEDPSNANERFDRNFIRQKLLPLISTRWPHLMLSVQRAINHFADSQQLLNELAEIDLAGIVSGNDGEPWLSIETFSELSNPRQENLLRFWLNQHQLNLTEKQLTVVISQVIGSAEDSQAELNVANIYIRRFQQRLYISSIARDQQYSPIQWQGLDKCEVPEFGVLTLSQSMDISLVVKPREGGESCLLPNQKQHKKLKNLLQDLAIPYWRRDILPLIYCEGELIAVADIIRCEAADRFLEDRQITFTAAQ